MRKCFNTQITSFDNKMCDEDESCSYWLSGEDGKKVYINGCIKSKFCGLTGMYKGEETEFVCQPKKVKHWIFLEGKDYLQFNESTKRCDLMIKPQMNPNRGQNSWVLGIPFNRAYFSIYDMDRS